MPFAELIHEYGYTIEEDGRVHGSRTFITKSDGAIATLPTRNVSLLPDEAGTNITGCYARRIRPSRSSDDPDTRYVVEYDTRSTLGTSGTLGITSDESSRTFDGSAEMMSITTELTSWRWDEAEIDMEEDLGLYKRAVLENFTISHYDLTTAEKNSLLAIMRDRAGTINAAAFEGYAIGQVLFDGWRGGDVINESGVRRWTLELVFIARLLTGEKRYVGGDITQDDWLYVWKSGASDGGFDKPKSKTSGEYLYRKTDFTGLEP